MIQESATFLEVLSNLIIWILVFLIFRKSYNSPFRVPTISRRIGIVLMLLFCLFAFWGGDYFHYKMAFNEYNLTGYINQEKVYEWFYRTFNFSYTALRFAIWGLALTALIWAYRRLSPAIDLTLFVFGTCFLPIFSYARASLAMSLILLGLSFIVNPGKLSRLFSLGIGFSLLGVSVFFHKSAPIGLSMAIASLFLIRADKAKLLLIALLAPLFVYILQQAFDVFAVMDLDSDTFITEQYRNRLLDTQERQTGRAAIGPLLNNFITRFPVYFSAALYVMIVWNGRIKLLLDGERAIAAYAFCITLLSILFSLDLGIDTRVLQYRTLYFSMPAYAVFLSAVRRCNIKPKFSQFVIYFACFSGFYQLFYATYRTLV